MLTLTSSAALHPTKGDPRRAPLSTPLAAFSWPLGTFIRRVSPIVHVTTSGSLSRQSKYPTQRCLKFPFTLCPCTVIDSDLKPSTARYTSDTTADIALFSQDPRGTPQSPTQPPSQSQSRSPSLRKLAMSHLMGAASSAPTSPTIHANGVRHDADAHPLQHGALPPPGVPSLTSALKSLNFEPGVSQPSGGVLYDSPYSRSISSTAPTSPRM